MKHGILFALMIIGQLITAQDTIRLMQYNLLNYGNYFSGCTSSNNNVNDKNEFLKLIVDFVKPDILCVNEMSDDEFYHDLILTEVLNIAGVNYFARPYLPNSSNSPIMNQVYYNTQKFSLLGNTALPTNYRDIDILKFKINTPGNEEDIFLNCAVAHLKAGDEPEERGYEVNQLMNYLNNSSAAGNYTFSGDFNLYTASEPAFQNMLYYPNESVRFYDPVNQIGSWNSNSYFAGVHTQSTHTSSNCASGGGMDDRFDFIMISDEIRDGTEKIKYLDGSYWAVGQDGQHYNQSILSYPTNSTVPSDVLNALYGLSDHLPVVIDLVVGDQTGFVANLQTDVDIAYNNPINESLNIVINAKNTLTITLGLMNANGQMVYCQSLGINGKANITIQTGEFSPGIYLLKVSDEKGLTTTYKIIKNL